MKIQFDPNQDFQLDAIKSVVDMFDGQTVEGGGMGFEIEKKGSGGGLGFSRLGTGNQLEIDDETLLENIQKIQERNDLEQADEIKGRNFTIEMETGTGKTYVYLRTIYELHEKYGFSKFIIVVPSISIREGVMKNLEITEEHFQDLYGNVPLDYFVYDSSRIGQLRNFATSDRLQIMVINIQAFRRDENIIKRNKDEMSGRKPIEFVQATNPVVVMDEPQNMESKKSQKAIANLNPLCKLRYSATHREVYNLLYRLTPVDALDLGLVKQIEVDSVREENGLDQAPIEVLSVQRHSKNILKAKMEVKANTESGSERKEVTAKVPSEETFDLHEITQREEYQGYVLSGIDLDEGYVEFSNGEKIYEGQSSGKPIEEIQKIQIEETVREHLEKEKKLREKGIKVLSLFFVDRVNNYRDYEAKNQKGKFARWFEEIYEDLTNGESKFSPQEVHDGYFSKDNKGRVKDSKTGSAKYDIPTYDLIMKNKERLLSFDEPVRFIFSHTALSEGWDNPNVFQICTLNERKSELRKRQEIGRGLRIPVDQNGERVFDKSSNILTVVANESYEDFAKQLQSEIEKETGVEFSKDNIKDRGDRRTLKLKKGWQADEEFLDLWGRIKEKTKYQVQLKTDELVNQVVERLKNMPNLTPPQIRAEKAGIDIDEEGVETQIKSLRISEVEQEVTVPNVMEYLSRGTHLTRQTIFRILEESDRIGDLLVNPQRFLDLCLEQINKVLQKMMVDGIKYEKVGEEYAMSLFESEELESYVDNMHEVQSQQRTLFDHVIYDSKTERRFVEDLESMERVKFYIKLPSWFTIDTPIGTYNPDWAVVFNGDKRLYFVAESKESKDEQDLRLRERLKISCGMEHFEQLEGVEFKVATEPKELISSD